MWSWFRPRPRQRPTLTVRLGMGVGVLVQIPAWSRWPGWPRACPVWKVIACEREARHGRYWHMTVDPVPEANLAVYGWRRTWRGVITTTPNVPYRVCHLITPARGDAGEGDTNATAG